MYLEWWSDWYRVTLHADLEDACRAAVQAILDHPSIASYTVFEDRNDDVVPIKYNLSTGTQVLIIKCVLSEPITQFYFGDKYV